MAQTSGGQQDITSSAITDFSAAIGIIFGATADATNTAHARYCIGFCTEDQEGATGTAMSVCTAGNSRDAQITVAANVTRAAASGGGSSGRFLIVTSPSAPLTTVVAAADAIDRGTSGLANGVRLNWTTTPDAAYEMLFILFGGLSAQDIQSLANTNTWGFRADAGFCLDTSGSFSTGNGTANNDFQFNAGMWAKPSAITQGAIATEWDRDLVAPIVTDADCRVYATQCIGTVAGGTASTGMAITAVSSTQTTATNSQEIGRAHV